MLTQTLPSRSSKNFPYEIAGETVGDREFIGAALVQVQQSFWSADPESPFCSGKNKWA